VDFVQNLSANVEPNLGRDLRNGLELQSLSIDLPKTNGYNY